MTLDRFNSFCNAAAVVGVLAGICFGAYSFFIQAPPVTIGIAAVLGVLVLALVIMKVGE